MRCTQNEHFSITPRERTVTSGFNTILPRSVFFAGLACAELLVVVIFEPVEATYFIRTVVSAIASTDTAVVSHLVETSSVLCVVAATGHTVSQGALLQCWHSIGWNTTSGFSAASSRPVDLPVFSSCCSSGQYATSAFRCG